MSKEDTVKLEFTEKELLIIQSLISDRIGGFASEHSGETNIETKVVAALAQLQYGKVTRFFFPFFGGHK